MKILNTVITGTGSVIPDVTVSNTDFMEHRFFSADKMEIDSPISQIIDKFKDITGIKYRRYANNNQTASDLATQAALKAIESAGINPEELDQIIVAHNFGDITYGSNQSDAVPSLASRVKHKLGIKNPNCVPFDILFGCPGWIQALIQADAFIRAGMANKCLIIGAETLSRTIDKNDRDSMIFSDGAGAVILEKELSDKQRGIISTSVAAHTQEEVGYIYMDKTNNPTNDNSTKYIKMLGRKVYEYALSNVPAAMKTAYDKTGLPVEELTKIIIHQANEKMDEAIVQRFFKLYKLKCDLSKVMPMNIAEMGNSSVATIPTLYDMILRKNHNGHAISSGDIIMFASVGAGMNINAVVYKQ